MKNRKLVLACLAVATAVAATGVVATAAGSRTRSPAVVVFEPLGYVRVGHARPADTARFHVAVSQAAAAGGWKQESMEGRTLDGHERSEHVFRDAAGNEVRLNWASAAGGDAVLLVSGPPAAREAATAAVWSKLMPQVASSRE